MKHSTHTARLRSRRRASLGVLALATLLVSLCVSRAAQAQHVSAEGTPITEIRVPEPEVAPVAPATPVARPVVGRVFVSPIIAVTSHTARRRHGHHTSGHASRRAGCRQNGGSRTIRVEMQVIERETPPALGRAEYESSLRNDLRVVGERCEDNTNVRTGQYQNIEVTMAVAPGRDGRGRLEHVTLLGGNEASRACVRNRVLRMRLPFPTDGRFQITHPVVFTQG